MLGSKVSRRSLLGSVPAGLAGFVLARPAMAGTSDADDAYRYEVVRSDAEWRGMLTEDEYSIMREGATEPPKSHPLWESTDAGMYCCKGCDLPVYDARWKVVVDKGWLFYRHSEVASVMTSIDQSVYAQFAGPTMESDGQPIVPDAYDASLAPEEQELVDGLLLIEVHCRRCASHLGHLVWVDAKLLHCINGLAMNFTPASA